MFGLIVLGAIGVYGVICYAFVCWILSLSCQQFQFKEVVFALITLLIDNGPIIRFLVIPALILKLHCKNTGFDIYKTPRQRMPGKLQLCIFKLEFPPLHLNGVKPCTL